MTASAEGLLDLNRRYPHPHHPIPGCAICRDFLEPLALRDHSDSVQNPDVPWTDRTLVLRDHSDSGDIDAALATYTYVSDDFRTAFMAGWEAARATPRTETSE